MFCRAAAIQPRRQRGAHRGDIGEVCNNFRDACRERTLTRLADKGFDLGACLSQALSDERTNSVGGTGNETGLSRGDRGSLSRSPRMTDRISYRMKQVQDCGMTISALMRAPSASNTRHCCAWNPGCNF